MICNVHLRQLMVNMQSSLRSCSNHQDTELACARPADGAMLWLQMPAGCEGGALVVGHHCHSEVRDVWFVVEMNARGSRANCTVDNSKV